MSTYDNTSVEAGLGFLAMIGGFILIIGIIALVISIIGVIGQWKAFKKAGKGGWEAIIPIYNQVVNCQITGVSPWWVLIVFVAGLVLNIIPIIGSALSMAVSIYFLVLLNVSTARSFGKSDGFAAGLIFLSPFFWFVLGGKNTQYVGAKPMNDVVMNWVQSKKNGTTASAGTQNVVQTTNVPPTGVQPTSVLSNNVPTTNASTTTEPTIVPIGTDKYCTSCGTKMSADQKFCTNCGKEN